MMIMTIETTASGYDEEKNSCSCHGFLVYSALPCISSEHSVHSVGYLVSIHLHITHQGLQYLVQCCPKIFGF